MPCLSSLNNVLSDIYVISQEDVDYFEIKHKHMLIFGRRCSTPVNTAKTNYYLIRLLLRGKPLKRRISQKMFTSWFILPDGIFF